MINVKAMPSRFLGNPVVKAAVLRKDRPGTKPYQAVIITVGEASDPESPHYNWHYIVADGVTDKWFGIDGEYDLTKAAADSLFREYEQKRG